MTDFHNIYVFVIVVLMCYSLSVLDILLTIKSVKKYKIIRPGRDPNDMELNKIAVWLWNTFGYSNGMIIQLIMSFVVILGLSIITYLYEPQMFFFFFGLTLGALIIINLIHKGNLEEMNKIEMEKQNA